MFVSVCVLVCVRVCWCVCMCGGGGLNRGSCWGIISVVKGKWGRGPERHNKALLACTEDGKHTVNTQPGERERGGGEMLIFYNALVTLSSTFTRLRMSNWLNLKLDDRERQGRTESQKERRLGCLKERISVCPNLQNAAQLSLLFFQPETSLERTSHAVTCGNTHNPASVLHLHTCMWWVQEINLFTSEHTHEDKHKHYFPYQYCGLSMWHFDSNTHKMCTECKKYTKCKPYCICNPVAPGQQYTHSLTLLTSTCDDCSHTHYFQSQVPGWLLSKGHDNSL